MQYTVSICQQDDRCIILCDQLILHSHARASECGGQATWSWERDASIVVAFEVVRELPQVLRLNPQIHLLAHHVASMEGWKEEGREESEWVGGCITRHAAEHWLDVTLA